MKVKDLLEEINKCKKQYGDDFLNWDVFTEQLCDEDKQFKKNSPSWKFLTDSEGWEYCECAGYWTKFEKEKAFTINVNY